MNNEQNNVTEKKTDTQKHTIIVIIFIVVLILIVIGIIVVSLTHNDKPDTAVPIESAAISTSTTTEDASKVTTTSTEKSTSTEPATTITATKTNLNLESYIGYWHIENEGERELIIESVSSDKIIFSFWLYRDAFYEKISAELDGNTTKFNSDGFGGTLVFNDNTITMTVTSDKQSLNLNDTKMIFSMKVAESVAYKNFENSTDDIIVNGLDCTNFGEIVCSETIDGMDSSYILNDGTYKTIRTNIQNGWHITTNVEAYSHGSWWYECYDTDDGDYYGWINARYIYLYVEEPTKPNVPDIPYFTQSQLNQIARSLGVPDSVSYTTSQGEIYYWDGGGIWLRYVDVYCDNGAYAGADVDAYTGAPQRSICEYSHPIEEDLPNNDTPSFDEDMPNVWCPDCGYGFFVTGVGTDGLTCPQCGTNFIP